MNWKTIGALAIVLTSPALSGTAEVPAVLSLDAAIQQALQASPRLHAAQAQVEAGRGAEQQSAAWLNPEAGIEAENIAGSGAYTGTDAAEYTYSLSQRLELGGKRAARQARAGAERMAAESSLQAERLNLIRNVTTAYAESIAAEESLRLTTQNEKLAKEMAETVGKRVNAARDPLIYRSQANIALATAKLTRQQAERKARLAQAKLAMLWGGGALSQPLNADILTAIPAPEALVFYQSQLAQNPDLSRYTLLNEARAADLRLEQAQSMPDPALSLGLRDFKETGSQALVVGMSMPLPVFNRNQGNVLRAGAELARQESEQQQARLEAEQQLQTAWNEWQAAHAETQDLKQTIIPTAEEALKLAREGYNRGRFSFLEVLGAQRSLIDAQSQLNQARLRQWESKTQVERLTATHLSSNEGIIHEQ